MVEALRGHSHMVQDVLTLAYTGPFPATGQTTAAHRAFLHEELADSSNLKHAKNDFFPGDWHSCCQGRLENQFMRMCVSDSSLVGPELQN